ncbi:hypothetical protein MNBD_GAMMA02-994 [hydrothermal vent metagenome]|uniref:Uncharacterized protein n=1 Tax=hydrothermal vent metagenome TaxID=652676 RepID=A0A3B0WC99_9ZZZZ
MVLFSSVLPYFTDPLIWIGFILLLVFLLTRYFLNNDIITELPAWLDAELPRRVLKHGFVVGLLVIVLGIGLKYHELSEAEQSHAINLVKTEINNNLSTIEQLAQNTQTLIDSHQAVSGALRSGDSVIMNRLFPSPDQPSDEAINFSKIVEASFTALKESNLLKSKGAMKSFNSSKDQIKSIIYPHNQVLISIQDPNSKQYAITIQMWHDHKEVIARAGDFDQLRFEDSLATMHAIRKQYQRTLRDSADYFTETLNFMERNTFIGNGAVFEILTKEDQALQSLSTMHSEITAGLKALKHQPLL